MSAVFTLLLFLRYYFTYYSKQLANIWKSYILDWIFCPKSVRVYFLLVVVGLPLILDSSMFLLKLMILTVCLLFLIFVDLSRMIGFCLFLLILELEKASLTDIVYGLNASFLNKADTYLSSVLSLIQWRPFDVFLCLGSKCWFTIFCC